MIKPFTKDAMKTKQETLCIVTITIFAPLEHDFENLIIFTALFRTPENLKA